MMSLWGGGVKARETAAGQRSRSSLLDDNGQVMMSPCDLILFTICCQGNTRLTFSTSAVSGTCAAGRPFRPESNGRFEITSLEF